MKKTLTFIFTLLFILQGAFVHAQMIQYTYDFNGLTMGNLNGQDNWTTVINSNPACTADLIVAYNQAGGLNTPDNTLGVFFNNSGGNYGRTASRLTTPAFPFNFSIGGIMEIEADIHTAWWGCFFGFGYDANSNGYVVPGIEQTVNYESNEGGIGIYLTQQNTNNTVFMKPDGTKVHIVYDSIAGWNKWKFFIDFDANNGAGSISLFAKKPAGNWINIPAVQSLNLGLTPGSNDKKDPAKWTKLFVQALGGYSAFDNIVIRQPNTGGLLYQYLVFNNPPLNHLTTDAPFVVNAVSSKGLPVSCTITGPATITGDTLVTLTGDTGVVTITAHQSGNATIAAAQDVSVSFNVINPSNVFPQIDIKNPVDGNVVRSPHLNAIPFSVAVSIAHSDLLSISQVNFMVNTGQTFTANPTNNGYYIGYWTPSSFGTYTLTATAVSSGGVSAFKTVTFQVVPDSTAITYKIIDTLHFANITNNKLDTTLVFPSFSGTYSKITAFVKYDCPPEGCEAWDVIAYLNIRGANGDWVELLRYITPYALACGDSIDVTDFASQLQGKIDISTNFPSASKVSITLIYKEGTPPYKYSWMDKLWLGSYPFGTWTTGGIALQPVEVRQLKLTDTNITAAYLRVLSTGHSGPNNTGNAAEFYDATHNFKINGTTAFTQHLWRTCNPNPAGCMPQNGTWTFPRAGWCPGSIPMLSQYDVSSYIGANVNLMYEFAPSYVDLCSSFNPNCTPVSGSCDCANTENPRILVAGTLITYFGGAPPALYVDNTLDYFKINVYPNPSKGFFHLSVSRRFNNTAIVKIYNLEGIIVREFNWNGEEKELDLSGFSNGIYVMKVNNKDGFEIKKLIIQ